MFLKDADYNFCVYFIVLMNNHISEFSHPFHALEKVLINDPMFMQYSKSISIGLWNPILTVGYDMARNIYTYLNHHLKRSFYDPLGLPFGRIDFNRQVFKFPDLTKIFCQLRKFSQNECLINHVKTSHAKWLIPLLRSLNIFS